MSEPRLGQLVIFQFSASDGPRGGQFHSAAVIIKVRSSIVVDVQVFCADGQLIPYKEIMFVEDPELFGTELRMCWAAPS